MIKFDGTGESKTKNEEVLIVLDMNSVCRFCLETGGGLTKIFEGTEANNALIDKLNNFVDIEVFSDGIIDKIMCFFYLYLFNFFHLDYVRFYISRKNMS